MYKKHPCDANDSYRLAYEHGRQLECAVHLLSSAEVSLDKLERGKYQLSDGEKELCEPISVADMEFKKPIADIRIENAATFLDSVVNFSQTAKSTQGTETLENGKRPSNNICGELVNKRAKKEGQAGRLGHLTGNSSINIASEENVSVSEEPEWKIAASVPNANGKSPAATNLCLPSATCNIFEFDTRQCQPAAVVFFPGYEYLYRDGVEQLEDVHSPFSHRRCVPIGRDHQADLPQWTPWNFKRSSSQFGFHAAHLALSNVAPSLPVIENNEVSVDKWLGTCVMPMPRLHSISLETQICCSKEDCDCADERSIRCVRQHVMDAREKLKGELGMKEFTELGFLDMGEDVAVRWTEEEENLFHMIVLSNSASLGRDFWTMLPRAFPSRNFKEIVSYYFNVFMLRKRADQNRMDPLNVDSDNDEWQDSSDGEFETSDEEQEEEDSVVESPADRNSLTLNDDSSEELDFDDEADGEEYQKHLVGTDDEGFYCGSGGSTRNKPMPQCKQTIDGNSRDCSLDQDVQDDSCTSFEGQCNVSGSCVERDQEYLHMERRNNCMVGFADYEYIDGPRDSKPWEINYIGATEKDFDFFPTCNVLEEVFGKEYRENEVRNGSGFS